MQRITSLIITIAFVATSFAQSKRVALVIGNQNYDGTNIPALRNPANDARAMSAKLENMGFEISGNKPLINANRDQMLSAIEQFRYDSRDADIALFYYSGHGASRNNKENLLLPTGTIIDKANIGARSIVLNDVRDMMQASNSKLNIIILDACRNLPFSNPLNNHDGKGIYDMNRGLVRNTPPSGFVICYATSPGETAGQGITYSPFTEALLGEIDSNRSFTDMFYVIKNKVKKATNNRQDPIFDINELNGFKADFSLYPRKSEQPNSENSMESENNLYSKFSTHATKRFEANGVSFNMVFVNGGTYRIGLQNLDKEQEKDYTRIHDVEVSPFFIGETEVTQELWEAVMGNNPSHFKKGKNYPIEQVSWKDCTEFINRLNTITGQSFRFPTEDEWEYVACEGDYGGELHIENVDDVAWYLKNSGDKYLDVSSRGTTDDIIKNNNCCTHEVKTKKPNKQGVYDILGNVYEWCSDRFVNVNETEFERIAKGGCWFDLFDKKIVYYRGYHLYSNLGFDNNGLRLVLPIKKKKNILEKTINIFHK